MADAAKPAKRRKVTHKKPNSLFEEWLKEWRDEAKEKGWQIHFTYQKALKALQQYPIPMKSGKECAILKNFGTKLCDMIDKRLAKFKEEHPDDPRLDMLKNAPATQSITTAPKAASRKRPASNSPKKKKPAAKKASNDAHDEATLKALQSSPDVHIKAGQAQVKLLVDCSETSAASTKKATQRAAMKELQLNQVPFEVRDLSVGDFMWIAIAPDGSELVLPYIIERKRSDDLAHSIKGTRYKEQKSRLKACGLNVIYLIEATAAHLSLPQETLFQAQTNTEIIDKFCVHNTANVKETISYLSTITRMLQRKIQGKEIKSCPEDQDPEYSFKAPVLQLYHYKEFKDGSAKIEDFTVREMFAQHLLQISGTSADAVCAIVQKFPTLALMREAFAKCLSDSERIGLLTVLLFGSSRKSLPKEVATRIVQFYTAADFSEL